MKVFSVAGAALMVIASAAAVHAADIESGIEVGGRIGPYSTTKCAGAEDGVKVGQSLCYT